MYELEIGRIKEKIQNNDYKRILLQAPEGMMDLQLQEVVNEISGPDSMIFVVGDPSYGVCDLAMDLAKQLKCELLIHFGHSTFGFQNIINSIPKGDVDVMIIPAYYNPPNPIDFSILRVKLDELGWEEVGLAATIQHVKTLEELENFLNKSTIKTFRWNKGQILGCNVRNIQKGIDKINGIISIHAGFFHTHGILLNLNAPLIQLNPYTEEISYFGEIDRKNSLQKRLALLTNARKAKKWGIIGSTKLGQLNMQMINKVNARLNFENNGTVIVVTENINPQNIANMSWIDAWVVTACPRIAIDDKIRFLKPVVTFREFLYLFNELSWEDLLKHGFF